MNREQWNSSATPWAHCARTSSIRWPRPQRLAAAAATAKGTLSGVTEISRVTKLLNSTVSRLLWEIGQRGLLEYTADITDHHKRLVRANLDAFK